MFKDLIERIAQALDQSGLPYMIIGGQAVLYYGEPRFTKDIDITLGADTETLGEVLSLTAKLNLNLLVKEVEDFVRTLVRRSENDIRLLCEWWKNIVYMWTTRQAGVRAGNRSTD